MRNYPSEIKIDPLSSWGVFKFMVKMFLINGRIKDQQCGFI